MKPQLHVKWEARVHNLLSDGFTRTEIRKILDREGIYRDIQMDGHSFIVKILGRAINLRSKDDVIEEIKRLHYEGLNRTQIRKQITHKHTHIFMKEALGPAPSQSGFRGVYQKHGKWIVVVHKNKSRIRIGLFFDTAEEAARAYDAAARHYHGDKAKLNFPDDEPQ